MLDVLVWALRGIGGLYFVGGLIGLRHAWFMLRAEPMMDELLDTLDVLKAGRNGEPHPPKRETDRGRACWLISGCALLIAAGAAMALASRSAIVLLAALIGHQLLYFARQHRKESAAPNADQAEEARPARSTLNAFFGALLVAVFAAWLGYMGALT